MALPPLPVLPPVPLLDLLLLQAIPSQPMVTASATIRMLVVFTVVPLSGQDRTATTNFSEQRPLSDVAGSSGINDPANAAWILAMVAFTG